MFVCCYGGGSPMSSIECSVVVPVFNEEEAIPLFLAPTAGRSGSSTTAVPTPPGRWWRRCTGPILAFGP